MLSKQNRVLAHLKANKAITPLEALEFYGSMRLGAIIHKLRELYIIETEMVDDIDRFGNNVRYARYHYRGEIDPKIDL